MTENNISSEKSIFSHFDDKSNKEAFAFPENLNLNELILHHDRNDKIIWCKLSQTSRPCFTFDLGEELENVQIAIEKHLINNGNDTQYFIFGSDTPGIFNLGGDLELFVQCIRDDDIGSMKKYAHKSVSILDRNLRAFNSNLITIGLVQGNALGGGFEFAMSFDILVAEKSTKFGLPEILFNLFPGMGAYSFLARKIGNKAAEEMILGGSMYSGQQLFDMGVVDILAEDGEGEACIIDYISNNRKRFNAEKSIYDARKIISPITKDELIQITNIWAEKAMKLGQDDLRKMERLVRAQKRLTSTIASKQPKEFMAPQFG